MSEIQQFETRKGNETKTTTQEIAELFKAIGVDVKSLAQEIREGMEQMEVYDGDDFDQFEEIATSLTIELSSAD